MKFIDHELFFMVSWDLESWFEETLGRHVLRIDLGTRSLVTKNSKLLYTLATQN